jgi:nitrate/TMAO reductase-like tetraheme cytochrome c subunit
MLLMLTVAKYEDNWDESEEVNEVDEDNYDDVEKYGERRLKMMMMIWMRKTENFVCVCS